jgi:hypothetical protein
MSDTISIKGLDKAAVLCALFNGAKQIGAGAIFHPEGAHHMTPEAAVKYLALGDDNARHFNTVPTLNFDYLLGRPLKVDLSQDDLYIAIYDHYNGQGAAQKALSPFAPNK